MKYIERVYSTITKGLVIMSGVALFSCSSFLEETPTAILTDANFYQTTTDAISAVDAIYASVQSGNSGWYFGNFYMTTDVNTDDMFTDPNVGNATWQAWSQLNINSEIDHIGAVWNQHYITIGRANAVIELVAEDIDIRDRLVAEAKFFRALAYFDLVRFFGDVPVTTSLIKDLDDAFVIAAERTASVDVYEQIEQDLMDAAAVLPDQWSGGDLGRVTAGSAYGLLAKVYLTWAGQPLNDASKYALAVEMADEVVNNRAAYGYGLEENYLDAFRTNVGKESLFEAQMKSGIGVSQGGSLAGITTLPRNLSGILGSNYRGNGLLRPTPDLVKAFDPEDQRYQTGMFSSLSNPDGATATFDPHVFKYIEVEDILYQGLVLNDGGVNTKVLRFADVLLMYAEALNEVNNGPTAPAYDAINEVRNRAGLDDLSALDYNGFKEAVYKERRLELFGEGHRWFDLVRQGRYVSTLEGFSNTLQDFPDPATTSTFIIEKNIQPYYTLMPIPQAHINILETDKDLQNPGY
ncbi:RagB/SusD family nutrient uptake outer membrane protein [Echinicola strongylocentroti]|nr:RagB/SusD family nutrient uptake outer membrane protein [Echinicola strongylocentroti]